MYSDKVAETPMWFVADRGNLRGVGGARSTDVSYGRTGLQGRMKHPMTREHVNTWRIGATRAAYRRLKGVAAGARVVQRFHLCGNRAQS